MSDKDADEKADISAVIDRGKPVSMMELMLISSDSRYWGHLTDLAFGLAARSTGFRRILPIARGGRAMFNSGDHVELNVSVVS